MPVDPNKEIFDSLAITIDTTQAEAALAGLQQQADTLLETLKQCKGACEGCQVSVRLNGADLVGAVRAHDYKALRTK